MEVHFIVQNEYWGYWIRRDNVKKTQHLLEAIKD